LSLRRGRPMAATITGVFRSSTAPAVRLPDGTFAPMGRGRVLRANDHDTGGARDQTEAELRADGLR
jgi:hypothetical protein